MKRDEDLLRALLLRLESEDEHISASFSQHLGMSPEARREFGHVQLLADAGFVALSGRGGDIVRITNRGHDFLAAIRQEGAWSKTKELAEAAGAKTLSMLFEIAVGLAKQKLKEVAGLEV